MSQKDLKQSAAKTSYKVGDCIRGEKVTAQARRVSRVEVVAGTSTHKIQQIKLEGSVLCIVDRPLNYIKGIVQTSD
jgi:hypothetical protein